MRNYDKQVYNRICKELKISSKIVHFIKYPWLFNLVVTKANSSKILKEKLTLAMTDLEIRKELNSPAMRFAEKHKLENKEITRFLVDIDHLM